MRKVLFTESQIKRILEAESVDCGYLDINSPGTEAPDNVEGVEVTMPGDKVSDRIAKIKKSGRGFPFGAHYSRIAEDIETQKYITNDQQKNTSANTGTKMGLNIAASKENSNGTMRKRKHDIEKHKRELPKNVFDKTYGRIEKIVKASLQQMSNTNNAINNKSDASNLTNANDATKVNKKQGKGHHKDGEQIGDNATLHYFQ